MQSFYKIKYPINKPIFNSVNRLSFSKLHLPFKIENNRVVIYNKEEKENIFYDKKFYFEYQWNKIQKQKKAFYMDFLSDTLNNHQKHECEVLFNIIKEFNYSELMVFYSFVKKYANNNPVGDIKYDIKPQEYNPNYADTQEILRVLTPFLSSGYFLKSKAPIKQVSNENKEEQKTAEPVKEKKLNIVNVKMVAFDQAKKIALIKEFRNHYNYGLKEAKEAVEKAPYILHQNMKIEEAEALKKKLEEAGAKIEFEV